ncbi:MAG: CDP-glycerol glycerophosphotransferase family protein [Gammaproteobacteria bacterium]|nr:CDP-glycerol glycerophosphotransferase family protein [Gammaproteobacteria bacterium]MDH3767469.1 CDP-glycerol glycerophosphotransferase family protein [Gammaproteobacteria bacterium]
MVIDLKTLFGVLARPLLFLIYFLSGFFPRNRHKLVFGSWSGHRYTDNTGALFEYLIREGNPKPSVVWISRESKIVRQLRERGLSAFHAWSPGGLLACLTAGIYVVDGLTKDINHWTSRGAQRVLLRHGVGIKNVERAIDSPSHHLYKLFHGNLFEKLFWRFLLPWHTIQPDFIIATSPEHARQAEVYYGVDSSRIEVTGFPRNDQLYTNMADDIDAHVLHWLDESRQAGLPVFLFLPTFRDNQPRLPFSWIELNEIAQRVGVRILFKLHYVDDRRGVAKGLPRQSHICLADASIAPASLFHKVDALISDYSSVIYDFMLTRKPIVFFVPDYEQYSLSRSFFYDYETVTPGPKVTDMPGLEAALRNVTEHGHSKWAAEYERVLDKFHTFKDAGSCERTYAEILRRCIDRAEPSAHVEKAVLPQVRRD